MTCIRARVCVLYPILTVLCIVLFVLIVCMAVGGRHAQLRGLESTRNWFHQMGVL